MEHNGLHSEPYSNSIYMKKGIIIITFVLVFLNGNAQTGIGTTTPVNKLQVETTLAEPATSGTAANGNLRLSGSTGSHVLDFGLSSSSTYSWLQARSKLAYGTTYNLLLNPIGGSVGIGTTSPQSLLHVKGGYLMAEYSSPVYVSFNHSGAPLNKKIIRIGNDNGSMIFDVVNDAYTTSTERMRIDSNGNIGINKNNPSRTLDVNGDIATTGNLTGGNVASSTLSGFSATMNTQTGTSYTLLTSDNGKIITFNNASPITLTVPSLFAGFNCMIIQLGAGQVTLSGSGTTITNRSGLTKTGGANAIATLIGITATTFISGGDLSN
jgi:hypothetical protein